MRAFKYILRVVWSDSSKLWRVVNIAVIALPAFLATPQGQDFQRGLGIENPVVVPTSTALIVAVFVAMLWIIVVLARTAVRQEKELTPALKLEFLPDGGGIVETPEKHHNKRTGELVGEHQAIYVRVRATALSRKAVTKCAAYLVAVDKRDGAGVFQATPFFDPIHLPWAHVGLREVDISRTVPRHFDVLKTHSRKEKLDFAAPWPLVLRNFFAEHTTYRIKIAVTGDGIDETITVEIDWNGQWEAIAGRTVQQ